MRAATLAPLPGEREERGPGLDGRVAGWCEQWPPIDDRAHDAAVRRPELASRVGEARRRAASDGDLDGAPPVVREADLTLRNVVVAAGRISFEALNAGFGTVSRTTVQGRGPAGVVFQTELSDLTSDEPRVIVVDTPADGHAEDLRIVIDPFNDVLESDESNNLWLGAISGG